MPTILNLPKVIDKLGLTQEDVANLTGISPRTLRGYLKDGIANIPFAILMTLIQQNKITADDIRKTGQSPFLSSPQQREEMERRFCRPPINLVIAPRSR